jgi:hypothetical protein
MCYGKAVRTTLDIDEDVLGAAKQFAAQQGITAGKAISDLVRQALAPQKTPKIRNGVPLFEPVKSSKRPHLELVNRLRDSG